jgi:hypothetical protein
MFSYLSPIISTAKIKNETPADKNTDKAKTFWDFPPSFTFLRTRSTYIIYIYIYIYIYA